MPRLPFTSTVKSHGRRTAARATSMAPSAPEPNRSSALEASSTVTAPVPPPGSGRSAMNVADCAQTLAISPVIHSAMSIRWQPRSAIVVPPIARSNRQSKGVAGSVNSSDSQVARHSLTSPTAPSATMRRISAMAGSRR